ncbi:MAG: fumarylacetoacetate hydrolase family protein [Rikenellaceae bacterium]
MKIVCIGCNYAQHVPELKADASGKAMFERPEKPMFFVKPDTALLRNNDPFFIPSFSEQIDYECELVVKITRVTKCIDKKFARRCYDEVGLGIDFTARDIQREAVAKGLPWELCKGFDHSAAISPTFISLDELGGDAQNLNFEMMLNGVVRQSVSTSEMLFSVDEIISYVSQFMTLKIGDLIFTGTPVGVGSVAAGDNIVASLNGRKLLDFDIK